MLKRVQASFRGPPAAAEVPDEEALLKEISQLCPPAALLPFAGSSELPSAPPTAAPHELPPAEVHQLLLRYLTAEKWDVAKAAKRLHEQAAWRLKFGSVSEEDVAGEVASGKAKLIPPTAGSCGRPLLIIKGSLHRAAATPLAMQQFIYFCLETSSHYCWDERNPDGKLVAMFDLAGLQLKNLDAAALRASFHMLATHFPERMVTVWMLEAPLIFFGMWKLVEPFIDSTARKNIKFVYGKEGRDDLIKSLGAEIVPVEYGGTAAEVPVELAARQLTVWRLERQQQPQPQKHEEEEGDVPQHAVNGLRLSRSSPTLLGAP